MTYRETPRSYRSTVIWALAILAGFALDTALGGGAVHALAWLGALVVVAGFDALTVRSSRRLQTVTVTDSELLIGELRIPRAGITAVDVPAGDTVLAPARMPGGATLVGVHTGDTVLGVASRTPQRLAAALGFAATPDLLQIRPAAPEELRQLPDIEARADTVFTVAGIGPLPPPATEQEFADAPAVLVAGTPPVGFARLLIGDVGAHLESLAVLPGHMRRGVGGALVEAACEWAESRGYRRITLCTFAEVAWNGPFYASRGFRPLAVEAYSAWLRERRAEEVACGLDGLGRRVAMCRQLQPSTDRSSPDSPDSPPG